MKNKIMLFVAALFLLVDSSAQASLIIIGTATYQGENYNLIWDDDNNGKSIVWLDYTNHFETWSDQLSWAANLDDELTYSIYDEYNVNWNSDWRLPETYEDQADLDNVWLGWEGPDEEGNYDYKFGYNMVNSELGHLFYEELGNNGWYATDGTHPSPGENLEEYGLQNTGDFENLVSSWYWSATLYNYNTIPDISAWVFSMSSGKQDLGQKVIPHYGLAVRSGEVSNAPLPGAVWLLGSGLLGLISIRRRRS